VKAKIAFMYKPKDLRIEEVEMPALKPGQVLIKIGACGICGSDVECFEGKSAEGRYDLGPYTPGHEWCGEIIETGVDIKSFKVGDKVASDCVMHCGVCENCRNGLMPSACLNFREVGFRPDSPGGMGEYMIIEENYLIKIPTDWSFEEGAWVETFSIPYFGIWGNGGHVDASDDVVILGAGPIGICAAMIAKTSGAKTIVVEPVKYRRDNILKYGADAVIDPLSCNLAEEIKKHTGEKGPDVVVEASGNDRSIASIFDIAGHSARVRLIGHSIGRKIPIEIGKTIWRTLNITGSGGTKDIGIKTVKFMDRIKDKYDFSALITHRFPFEKIHEAFAVAANKETNCLKTMLNFEK